MNTEEITALMRQIDRPVRLMEVCGTHTVSAFRSGLRSLLPGDLFLISGPGCPVCVTPSSYLRKVFRLASLPEASILTFGDLLRVPADGNSLEKARARGADVRMVYSPADALALARSNPNRRIIFLGVGFETTSPAVAWTIAEARRLALCNYFVLCGHKTIPEAMTALLDAPNVTVDGFLCPGHVSTITGSAVYEDIAARYHVPCVVAGFEASDMSAAIAMLLRQIAAGRAEVEIQYTRGVSRHGNAEALRLCGEVFEQCPSEWRGLGTIPSSGLRIRETFRAHDADALLPPDAAGETSARPDDLHGCRCGEVLRGAIKPTDCPLFAGLCSPSDPFGPCMVSSEGACAAYYKYSRQSFCPQ